MFFSVRTDHLTGIKKTFAIQPSKLYSSKIAPGGWYSHEVPVRVCAVQGGRDFGAPDLERGIHINKRVPSEIMIAIELSK